MPAVMFQGTASNVGKSVLAAAFCRILLEDGYRVAPFKAQNISLNSFVTAGGGEMGRAQVVQAQACRLDPDVRMNPVLLKPSSDAGLQVIVMGRPVANMSVARYEDYTPEAREQTRRAYDSLASEFEVIVLEGAGSPAEINLRATDFVNMSMAAHARARVLLVGDIDCGGVFASFVGTMALLPERERRLVTAFVINKFRGDKSLLAGAVADVERRTGKPTWGIVPFVDRLGLPDEDSVTFKTLSALGGPAAGTPAPGRVVMALVDLPHASNLSDFDPLLIEPDVAVRIVRSTDDLRLAAGGDGPPDAVILPGSKNTLADLEFLRVTGLADAIGTLARSGLVEVVGLCAGFQMLGDSIADPLEVESDRNVAPGLGLLPLRTSMAADKTLRPAEGRHLLSGHAFRGYEIHHGFTELCDGRAVPALLSAGNEVLGAADREGMVWGTYVHGVLDSDRLRRWFIDRLRVRKGLEPVGEVVARYDVEPALENLARVVRDSVEVRAIYRSMGLE